MLSGSRSGSRSSTIRATSSQGTVELGVQQPQIGRQMRPIVVGDLRIGGAVSAIGGSDGDGMIVSWFPVLTNNAFQTARSIPDLLVGEASQAGAPRIIIRSAKIRDWCPSCGWIFDRFLGKIFADFG